jgi:ubiquitin carboxyl-terminal hydrolase 36/42
MNNNIKLHGLPNIGNTCYLNACIQTLKHIPVLMYELIYPRDKIKILLIFRRFFKDLLKDGINNKYMFNFYNILCRNINIDRLGIQGDSSEVLSGMLSIIIDNSKVIEKIFRNKILSEIKCSKCNHISKTYQNSHCLNLNIPNNKKSVNLLNLINLYQKNTILDNENKYKCEKCNQYSNASKKMTIEKTGNILVINLNRHKYENRSKKNTIPITFTKNINIFNKSYKLVSIIEHTSGGDNSNSGHYINKSLNVFDNKWYFYSDSHVSETSLNNTEISTNNYVLVYISNKINSVTYNKIINPLKNICF